MSPNGIWIAYATGDADHCAAPNQLVVQELGTGSSPQQIFEGGDAQIVPLTWSPDSRRVLYHYLTADDVQIHEVEPVTGAPPRMVPMPEGAYQPTYLGDAQSLAVVVDDGSLTQVLEIDAASGASRRTLFVLPGRPAFRSLVVDPSGHHLLFTTFVAIAGGDRIWRWTESEPVVVLEAAQGGLVQGAVWVVPTAS